MKQWLHDHIFAVTVVVGLIIAVLVGVHEGPRPTQCKEEWLGYYAEKEPVYGMPCIWNWWKCKDNTIVQCYDSTFLMIENLKALNEDVEVVKGIIDGRKGGHND